MRSRACLRWGAVVLAVGLPVAACSSGNTNASSSSSGGHSILYATASEEMSDLNPFTGSLQGKTQVLSAIGTPMLYVNQSNQIASQSLKSWTVSNNDQTVTFTLKPGMKWSDGKPMTSADMKMSMIAYLDATISANAGRVGAVAGQDAIGKDTTSPLSQLSVSGLTTPNKQTLQIQLATPDVAWIAQMALNGDYWPILPEHILGQDTLANVAKDKYFTTWPVSSGPFTLEKWVNEQYVEVQRNPNWAGGKAGFAKVVFEIVNNDQMQAQLQTGQLQFVYPLDPTQVATVKAIKGVSVLEHEGVAPDTIGLNYAAPELKSPLVREALIYAINREAICKTALAGHCTISTPNIREIGPSWSVPTTGLNEYAYDPSKAKALLKQAGWNPNTQLVFLTRTADAPTYVEQAMTILQGEEAAVGVKIKLENVSTAGLLNVIGKKTGWDGFWVSGANFAVDPSEMAGYMQCSERYPNGPNTSQFCNPTVDTLFAKGLTQTDLSQRGATYQQIFTMPNHDPSEIYLYNVNSIAAYDSHIKGPVPFGYVSGAYWNIGTWHWQN
jgi:peptide/nickel transport system substrate-binding protein